MHIIYNSDPNFSEGIKYTIAIGPPDQNELPINADFYNPIIEV